jgi:hypothetical protein
MEKQQQADPTLFFRIVFRQKVFRHQKVIETEARTLDKTRETPNQGFYQSLMNQNK